MSRKPRPLEHILFKVYFTVNGTIIYKVVLINMNMEHPSEAVAAAPCW